GPHAGKMGGLVLIAFRGHPEVPLLCQVEIRIQCLQTRHERAPQACVVQRYEPILAIAPMLEPTHKDRAVQEIDHRSGAKRHDHLAQTDLTVWLETFLFSLLLANRHGQFLLSKSAKRNQMCVLGSTSRMDVGA